MGLPNVVKFPHSLALKAQLFPWNFWSNYFSAHPTHPTTGIYFSYSFLFCRPIYNLPDFTQLFLKHLLSKLKTRAKQQKVTLLQLETVSCLISISKNCTKTLSLSLILCLFNSVILQLGTFCHFEKCLCTRFGHVIMIQANKKRKQQMPSDISTPSNLLQTLTLKREFFFIVSISVG